MKPLTLTIIGGVDKDGVPPDTLSVRYDHDSLGRLTTVTYPSDATAGGTRLTETGLAVGTPAYMSPEQAAGETDIDARSDLYSLGCVLYEMLTGETPYTGPTPQAILAKKLTEPLPHVSVVRETVPAAVEAALATALAKTPADRYATAQQFATALGDPWAATGPVASRRTTLGRRSVAWVGLLAAACVVVAAAGNDAKSESIFPFYPAILDNVIDVTATDQANVKASFANYGPHVDLAAPGVGIYSTMLDNTYASETGTSMATPFVSGLAALLSGLLGSPSPAQVIQALESTALDLGPAGRDNDYGFGLIQADAAIQFLSHRLTVNKIGSGTVTSSPTGLDCGHTCAANVVTGTVVTLTAQPFLGATFLGWSDPACPVLVLALIGSVWLYQWLYESKLRWTLRPAPVKIGTRILTLFVVPKDDPSHTIGDLGNMLIVFGPPECDEQILPAIEIQVCEHTSEPKHRLCRSANASLNGHILIRALSRWAEQAQHFIVKIRDGNSWHAAVCEVGSIHSHPGALEEPGGKQDRRPERQTRPDPDDEGPADETPNVLPL